MIESNEKDSIISILQGIQPIDYQYSKLGRIMNGYFKKRSLDYIQKNIDKKIQVHEYYDLPSKQNQNKKDNNFFNIDFKKIDSYLKEYSKVNSLHHTYDTYKSSENKNKIKKKIKKINLKKKIEFTGLSKNQITADPGRYNPNFKSIFKNSYHAFFGSSQLKSNNQSNNSIDNNVTKIMTNISKSKSQSILKTDKGITLDETIQVKNNDDIHSSIITVRKNNSYKNSGELSNTDRNELNTKTPISEIKSNVNIFPNLYKRNNSRNFSKKSLLIKSNSTKVLKKINSSSLDFSKMSGRKSIFNIKCTPIYSPNYKYNLPHISTIRMPKEIPFQELKKIIVGKLIRTYKLNSDDYMIMEINRKYNND